MQSSIKKSTLIAGLCAVMGWAGPASVWASPGTDAVDAIQQSKKVTGVISDTQGPLIGATVMEKGTTNGTVTDIDGNFTLEVGPNAVLVVSYIGYNTQEVPVKGQGTLNISMSDAASNALNEVVVIGYGT